MNLLLAIVKISRPLNVIIAFVTVAVAAAVTGTVSPFSRVFTASLVAALMTAGANVINDIFDIDIDRVNQPERVLPSGQMSTKTAWILFIVLFVMAWSIALLLGPLMFLIAFSIGLLLFLYSAKLKRTVLWGNLCVSFATAMAFLYGGLAVFRIEQAIYPALFSFFFHFGREMLKDIQDREGDQLENALTFAVRFGSKPALILTYIDFILLVILTIYPYISGVYDSRYLIIVVFGVHTVLLYVGLSSWYDHLPKNLGRLSVILKYDMLIGLLAIFAGSQ